VRALLFVSFLLYLLLRSQFCIINGDKIAALRWVWTFQLRREFRPEWWPDSTVSVVVFRRPEMGQTLRALNNSTMILPSIGHAAAVEEGDSNIAGDVRRLVNEK